MIKCKEISEYMAYYRKHKSYFNKERVLLMENVVKPLLKRKDIIFDEETFHNCISFCERWYYKLFPYQKFLYAIYVYER